MFRLHGEGPFEEKRKEGRKNERIKLVDIKKENEQSIGLVFRSKLADTF